MKTPLALIITCVTTALAAQQPGDLDSTFGINGLVLTDFGSSDESIRGLAIQPDGKIVAGGISNLGGTDDFGLGRYDSNGALDSSFSGDGLLTTPFGITIDQAHAVAIQADGRIVAAGSTYDGAQYDFALARYDSTGTVDGTFGTGGKVITDFGLSLTDRAYAVAIQPDGRIVLAGYYNLDFAVARFNTDGSLDNSFSGDGKVTTDFGVGYDEANSMTLQPDGKIVVAGGASNGSNEDFAIARFNADGTLDNSFDSDGRVTKAFGANDDHGFAVAVQSDGRIVVAGYSHNGADADFALARYNTDGSLDSSFSSDGQLTCDFAAGDDHAHAIAIQSDGGILVVGFSSGDFALARYDISGTPDSTFSVDGKLTSDFGFSEYGYAARIQADGKIIVAGMSHNGSYTDFALARYLSGLNVGVVEFSKENSAPLIYPNPITETAILEYALTNEETITIQLTDIQGRTLTTIVDSEQQSAGEHQQPITLPQSLPAGNYVIIISSPKGRMSVQVVK